MLVTPDLNELVFLRLFYSKLPFHSRHVAFAPKHDKANTREGSKFKEFYLSKWFILNSWTKQLYYDVNISFRIHVKKSAL